MSPDDKGQLTPEELKAKGFDLEGGAPDKPGETKDEPPDDTGGKPGKYDGKSVEELRVILTEQEKVQGEMSGKIDKFKGDADYWRNKADAIDRERQMFAQDAVSRRNQPIDTPEPKAPAFNWEKPIDSVDERIDQRLGERDTAAGQQRVAEIQDDAKMAFGDGFKRAVRDNPRLFEGENFQRETIDFMYNYYNPYVQKGIAVSRYVGSPDVWKKVAQNKRLDRNEMDYLQPEKVSPVSPTDTNIPAGGKLVGAEDEAVHLESGAKEMVDFFKTRGYVKGEEEAAELVREERKGRAEKEV